MIYTHFYGGLFTGCDIIYPYDELLLYYLSAVKENKQYQYYYKLSLEFGHIL